MSGPGPAELGAVGQRILLENDRVRVWQVRLAPGETQPLHHHEYPYVVVAVQGATNVVETADGHRIDAPEPTGGVVFREPGATHTLTNIGETTYVGRLIELKGPRGDPAGAPVADGGSTRVQPSGPD